MPTKLYLPNLLEFIYHCITEKGINFLFNRLDREDYLKVRTEAKARKFAETANLEDKMIMMSKLGMGCAVVFWDLEKQKKRKVEEIVIGYLETDPNNLTRQLVKDKTFACRDIDFIKSLSTMSNACMSAVYSINRKFLQIKDKFFTRTLVNKLEAERNLEFYAKTVSFALNLEEVLESFKIDMLKFRTLLHLRTSPNGATKDNIARTLNRANVTGMINEMYNNNLVSFDLTNSSVIKIDTYGVIILDQVFSKFP